MRLPKGIDMLGMTKAKKLVEEKVTAPISAAVIFSAFAVILAVVAIMIGLTNAH